MKEQTSSYKVYEMDKQNPNLESDDIKKDQKGIFIKNIFILLTGTVFAQIISIFCAPIITRLYGPEAFGTLALFTSLITTVGVIICLRYEIPILIAKTDKQAANLLCLSLLITVILSFLSIFLLFFGGEYLIQFLHSPQLKIYLWLIPPTLFVVGLFQTMMFWNTRTEHFKRLSLAKGANQIAISGTQIGAGLNGYTNGGSLIFAYVFGQIMSCIVLSSQVVRDHYIFFRESVSKDEILIVMKRYSNFPIFDTWSALIGSITSSIPIFLLSAFFTLSVVGYYSLGMMVVQLPLSYIGSSLGQVFFQRASALKHEGERQLSDFVEKIVLKLMIIGIFPTIVFLFLGQDLFIVIFGAQWAEAGVYTQIFAIWIFIMVIASPISGLFAIFEQQKLILIYSIFAIFFRVIALYIGGIIGNVILTLVLFSLVSFFSYGVSLIWELRLSKVSIHSLLKKFVPYIIYCIPIIAIFLCSKWFIQDNSLFSVALSVFLGIIYFFIVIRNDEEYNVIANGLIDKIKNIIRQKI